MPPVKQYPQVVGLDDAESLFFGRELEHVLLKTYDVKYPQIKARDLFPVSYEAGPAAETIEYQQYDMVGMAQVLADYGQDLPMVDIKGKEFRSPVKPIAAAFKYSIQEIRAAKAKGLPLEQRKANSAKRACLLKEHNIALFGDPETGLPGFLSNPNIQEYSPPNDGTGSSVLWSTKTVSQVIRDLTGLVSKVITNTKGVESPDSLVLALSAWVDISTLQLPNTNVTALEFFLKNNPSVKNVGWLAELETAGAGSTRMAFAYRRDDDHVQMHVPQEFEMLPPQPKDLNYKIPCHQRSGGVIIPYPMAVATMHGF